MWMWMCGVWGRWRRRVQRAEDLAAELAGEELLICGSQLLTEEISS